MTEFVDSFGIYVTSSALASQASLLTRWNALGGGDGSIGVQAGIGSRGNPAMVIPFGDLIAKTHSHQATYTVGLRVQLNGSLGNVGGGPLHALYNNGVELATLRVNNDGTLLLCAGGNTANVVALSTLALLSNVFYYIEYTATISGSSNLNIAGQIWVNTVSVGSGNSNSGVNVSGLTSQTATFNRALLQAGMETPGNVVIQDYYLNNGSGATNTSVFGDVRIQPLFANADGGTLQWTPLSGSTQYLMINENPQDGDTSYLFSDTAGQKSIFGWQPIPSFTGTVKTVQISWCARKDDEGQRTFQGNIGTTGTEAQTPIFSLADNYAYYHQAFDLDPATSLPWTQTGFNTKKFGIELVS